MNYRVWFIQRELSSDNGGEERSLFQLMKAALDDGRNVGLITCTRADYQQDLAEKGVPQIIAQVQEWKLRGTLHFLLSVLQAARQLLDHKEHIHIHVNSYKDVTWAAAVAAIAKAKLTLHLRLNAPEYLSRQYRLGFSKVLAFVANSQFVQKDWKRYTGENRVEVIWNGIEICNEPLRNDSPKKSQVAFVGRIVPEKGLRVLLEAIPLMNEKVELLVIGSPKQALERGDGQYYEELKSFVVSKNLVDRVHFLGHKNDAYKYVSKCRTLVVPSFHDAFGRTLMEAYQHGIPVIASGSGGMGELSEKLSIQKKLIFDEGDPHSLAKILDKLLSGQIAVDSEELKEFAKNNFDIRDSGRKLFGLIDSFHLKT